MTFAPEILAALAVFSVGYGAGRVMVALRWPLVIRLLAFVLASWGVGMVAANLGASLFVGRAETTAQALLAPLVMVQWVVVGTVLWLMGSLVGGLHGTRIAP